MRSGSISDVLIVGAGHDRRAPNVVAALKPGDADRAMRAEKRRDLVDFFARSACDIRHRSRQGAEAARGGFRETRSPR